MSSSTKEYRKFLDECAEKVKVGDVFYEFKGPGKPYKCHIVAIVEKYQAVYRWYGRHKQWWHYQVTHVQWVVWAQENTDKNGAIK